LERRFSRGHFSNGKRGPQPSSIAVPRQGWALYESGMDFSGWLTTLNFPTFCLPPLGAVLNAVDLQKRTLEVLPKLTMSLLLPQITVSGRPVGRGFHGQIDNWLFPQIFCSKSAQVLPVAGIPGLGTHSGSLFSLLGQTVILDSSVMLEADRIYAVPNNSVRHELIGAFVAAFQGALAFAGKAELVGAHGAHEGYYMLPAYWHNDWTGAWNNYSPNHRRPAAPVYRLPIHP